MRFRNEGYMCLENKGNGINVLCTGAAGYIGSELVGKFLDAGYNVQGLDNFMYGNTDSLLRYVGHERFDFDAVDVKEYSQLKKYLAKADIVLPLAALVGYPNCEKKTTEANLVNLEVNRWIATNKSRNQELIYFCTNSGYGSTSGNVPCDESSPMTPVSVYGVTKVEAEKIYQNTVNCTTFRLATVFGPSTRMRTDLLVNNFVWNALRERVLVLYECTFMRNYVHIWDVCRAVIHALDCWDICRMQTYNVGNDSLNCNKLELAQAVQKQVPCEIIKAEINSDPDIRNYIVSSQKFYNTGFECEYDLDTGIRQLVKAYKLINQPRYGNY